MCLRCNLATRLPKSRGYWADFLRSRPPVLSSWNKLSKMTRFGLNGQPRKINFSSYMVLGTWYDRTINGDSKWEHARTHAHAMLIESKFHLGLALTTDGFLHHPLTTFTECLPLFCRHLSLETHSPAPENAWLGQFEKSIKTRLGDWDMVRLTVTYLDILDVPFGQMTWAHISGSDAEPQHLVGFKEKCPWAPM